VTWPQLTTPPAGERERMESMGDTKFIDEVGERERMESMGDTKFIDEVGEAKPLDPVTAEKVVQLFDALKSALIAKPKRSRKKVSKR